MMTDDQVVRLAAKDILVVRLGSALLSMAPDVRELLVIQMIKDRNLYNHLIDLRILYGVTQDNP